MATKPGKVQLYKERHAVLETDRRLWFPMYQLIGEYVMTRKQDFEVSSQPGEFLTEQLFSAAAPNANQAMASALLGNLWPNGARSVRLIRPRYIPDTPENKAYYEEITSVFTDVVDAPETGTLPAFQEYMLDQGAFGLSGVQVKRTGDLTDPLRVVALNVKYFLFDENKDGVVDTLFIERNLTARDIVDEFGEENVSTKVMEAYKKYDSKTKFRVVHVIEPRREQATKAGNKSYPISSVHFEWDTNKILKDSGYKKMPAIISRFLKALGEKEGRSPSMFAMPAIMRLNLVWEMLMRAGEKKLRPPMYLLDNGSLGNDTIDMSSGAISVFSTLGIGDKAPLGTLFDVGNLQDIYPIAESLVNDITKAYFIDALMDFNDGKRMTLGEAQIKDRIRGEGLNSVFKRQETECFSPFVNTCCAMLDEDGLMGVERGSPEEDKLLNQGIFPIYMPADVIAAKKRGQKIYKIKYISPASRIMRTEELQGVTQLLDINMAAAPVFPEMLDNIDIDKVENQLYELLGVDEGSKRDTKTKEAIREARAKMQQQMAQLEQMQVGSDVAMKMSQAQSMQQGAVSGRPKG